MYSVLGLCTYFILSDFSLFKSWSSLHKPLLPPESNPGPGIPSNLDNWVQFFFPKNVILISQSVFIVWFLLFVFVVVLWLIGWFVVVVVFFCLFEMFLFVWFWFFFTFFGLATCLGSKIYHQFEVPLHLSMVWPPVTPLECLAIG